MYLSCCCAPGHDGWRLYQYNVSVLIQPPSIVPSGTAATMVRA